MNWVWIGLLLLIPAGVVAMVLHSIGLGVWVILGLLALACVVMTGICCGLFMLLISFMDDDDWGRP